MIADLTNPSDFVPSASIQMVLASVASGQPLVSACDNAGISRRDFYRWLHDDPQLAISYALAVKQQTQNRFARS